MLRIELFQSDLPFNLDGALPKSLFPNRQGVISQSLVKVSECACDLAARLAYMSDHERCDFLAAFHLSSSV